MSEQSYIVIGVKAKDLLSISTSEITKTFYKHETGEPYTRNEEFISVTINGELLDLSQHDLKHGYLFEESDIQVYPRNDLSYEGTIVGIKAAGYTEDVEELPKSFEGSEEWLRIQSFLDNHKCKAPIHVYLVQSEYV